MNEILPVHMMRLLRNFIRNRQGTLLQVLIGMVIMGALSYTFWSSWEKNMTDAGASLKTKIESDSWLSE